MRIAEVAQCSLCIGVEPVGSCSTSATLIEEGPSIIREGFTSVSVANYLLTYDEARRRAPTKLLPCRTFRLGGQKSPWLISAADLAELIDVRREKAG